MTKNKTQNGIIQPMRIDYYIVFAGIIEQTFGNKLVTAINNARAVNATKIIIFFSSLGGNIQEGFTIASVIQNSAIPIAIHANNNIDSIANVIYLSAKERTAESYAKFYLHGTKTPPQSYDEKGLKEQLLAVRTENARIAQFVSENTTINFPKVQSMMKTGTTITSQKALQYGIVQSIIHKEVPPGALKEEILIVN
jgi:ATP-dependent protease ClpP protease subunit